MQVTIIAVARPNFIKIDANELIGLTSSLLVSGGKVASLSCGMDIRRRGLWKY